MASTPAQARLATAAALAISAGIVVASFIVARRTDVATLPDPSFGELVQPGSSKSAFKIEYLYGPVVFQGFGLFMLVMALIDGDRPKKWWHLAGPVAWCLGILVMILLQASTATRLASAP